MYSPPARLPSKISFISCLCSNVVLAITRVFGLSGSPPPGTVISPVIGVLNRSFLIATLTSFCISTSGSKVPSGRFPYNNLISFSRLGYVFKTCCLEYGAFGLILNPKNPPP